MKTEKIKRLRAFFARLSPVACVLSIMLIMALPVSAENTDIWLVDYNDYLERVTTVNGEDYCFVKTPISWTDWYLNEMDDEAVYEDTWEDTNLIYWEHTGNNYGSVSFLPLGDHRLDLTYIPYGTLVKLGIQMEYTTSFVDVKADVIVNYYDKNGNVIATRWDSGIDISYGSYVFCDVNLDYPTGAKSASFTFEIYKYSPGYMAEVYMLLKDFEMTLTIGSDTRIQEKLDKNNGLLEDVESEQGKTNEKLDEIISGSQEDQEAADKFGNDADTAIGDLSNAGDALDSLDKPNVDINGLVPGELLGSSYVSLVNVLTISWDQPTLTSMVTTMVGFFLISLLLFGKKG